MALTYLQSSALMQDLNFVNRVKVACLKFASFITIEDPAIPAHSARYRWAVQTLNNPNGAAQTITPIAVMDPQVQLDGSAITDVALQAAVEVTVNKVL